MSLLKANARVPYKTCQPSYSRNVAYTGWFRRSRTALRSRTPNTESPTRPFVHIRAYFRALLGPIEWKPGAGGGEGWSFGHCEQQWRLLTCSHGVDSFWDLCDAFSSKIAPWNRSDTWKLDRIPTCSFIRRIWTISKIEDKNFSRNFESPCLTLVSGCRGSVPRLWDSPLRKDSFLLYQYEVKVRKQCGLLVWSELYPIYTAQLIAYHLRKLQHGFNDWISGPALVENMGETHFVFNVENKKRLGFKGKRNVNYADVVSGGESMTLSFGLSGGVKSNLEAPFNIFMDKNTNYPIHGVPDNVGGVLYRIGLGEVRAINEYPAGQPILRVETAADTMTLRCKWGHCKKVTQNCVSSLKNATHLCQPLDSFVIRNFKENWRRECDITKRDMIAKVIGPTNRLVRANWIIPEKYLMKLASTCVNLLKI